MISYSPGYQSVLKNLKESTRQRFVAIELGFPPVEIETEVVAHEAGIDTETALALVRLGQSIRGLEGSPLGEVSSTRPAHTDGRVIFASAGRPVAEQRREILLQSALLGAGSLDRRLVIALRARPVVARRYLVR